MDCGERLDRGVSDRSGGYLLFLLGSLCAAGLLDAFVTKFRFTMPTYVREEFGISFSELAGMFVWVYLGSCLSIVVRVLADVIGRRAMLWVTIGGMAVIQCGIGYAQTLGQYIALTTVLALLFTADVYLLVMSEEAPPARRGLLTALTVGIGGVGAVLFGWLVEHMGESVDAWRSVARFGLWGLLVLVPFLFVRETAQFREGRRRRTGAFRLDMVIAPFRLAPRALIVLSILKMTIVGGALATIALTGPEFLRVDNGFDTVAIGRIVQIDVIASIVAWIAGGAMADAIGRRPAFFLFGGVYAISLLLMATLPKGSSGVMVTFVTQSFGATAVWSILRVATLEYFPTECRATGAAWTDIPQVVGAAAGAKLIAALTRHDGAGDPTVSLSVIIIGVAILIPVAMPAFALLRETRGRRLEDI